MASGALLRHALERLLSSERLVGSAALLQYIGRELGVRRSTQHDPPVNESSEWGASVGEWETAPPRHERPAPLGVELAEAPKAEELESEIRPLIHLVKDGSFEHPRRSAYSTLVKEPAGTEQEEDADPCESKCDRLDRRMIGMN